MMKCKVIKEVIKADLCTGCATCVSLCPNSAIELILDSSKGIYLPLLKEEKCNYCGICLSVCPGHSVKFKDLNLTIFGQEPKDSFLGNYLNCYIGHATNYEIRYNSASGGLVTALLIFALEEGIIDGALVTKMSDEKPLEPQPFIARNRREVISAAKSKYCPVPANIALQDILENEGKYAVVGLPCHLHGIRKAEMINKKLNERIVLHIGLFCGKNISFLGTQFLLQGMKVKEEEVEKLDYRGEGWPGSMTIQLTNKQRKQISIKKYYNSRFSSFVPWRCTLCSDGTSELADISFGDAWLSEVNKVDKVGTSIVISRNRQGEDILKQMEHKGKVKLSVISCDKVKESQGGFLWKKKDLRARFAIAKLIGKKVPLLYSNGFLLQLSFHSYLSSSLFYLQSFLASKRSLWWLFKIYCSLLKIWQSY